MSEEDSTPEHADSPPDGSDRRRFLLLMLMGGAGAAAAIAGVRTLLATDLMPAEWTPPPNAKGRRRDWVMLIDLKRCDGCRACTAACGKEHHVPPGQEWIKVYRMQGEGGEYFLPRPCMHCENAPCASVCPVGATFVRTDGVVLVDHRRCIGCRYCMAACPYNARYFNWGEPPHSPEELANVYTPEAPWPHRKGVVEKCVFCAHRADVGELPACVRGCPMKAIFFGDASEDAVSNGVEVWKFSEVVRQEGGFRFKEEMGTKPRVWYLPARRS